VPHPSIAIELITFNEPQTYSQSSDGRRQDQEVKVLRRRIVAHARNLGSSQKKYVRRKGETADQYDVGAVGEMLEKTVLYFGAAGGGVAFLKVAKDAITEWMGLSPRNKVKAKVGTTSIEVTGTRDLDSVMAMAMKAERDRKPKTSKRMSKDKRKTGQSNPSATKKKPTRVVKRKSARKRK
jgi:hypothetical protein